MTVSQFTHCHPRLRRCKSGLRQPAGTALARQTQFYAQTVAVSRRRIPALPKSEIAAAGRSDGPRAPGRWRSSAARSSSSAFLTVIHRRR